MARVRKKSSKGVQKQARQKSDNGSPAHQVGKYLHLDDKTTALLMNIKESRLYQKLTAHDLAEAVAELTKLEQKRLKVAK